MKRILSSFIFVLVLQSILCSAAFSNSQTYTVSVIIPAIAGVNVAPFNKNQTTSILENQLKNNSSNVIQELAIRDKKKVTLLTYVAN